MLLGGSTTNLRHYQRKRWTELSRPYAAFETVVGTKGCLVAGTQDKEYGLRRKLTRSPLPRFCVHLSILYNEDG